VSVEDVLRIQQCGGFLVDPATSGEDLWIEGNGRGRLVEVPETRVFGPVTKALLIYGIGAQQLHVDLISELGGQFEESGAVLRAWRLGWYARHQGRGYGLAFAIRQSAPAFLSFPCC